MHVVRIENFDPISLRRQQDLDLGVFVHATWTFVWDACLPHQILCQTTLHFVLSLNVTTNNGVLARVFIEQCFCSHNCPRKAQVVFVLDLNDSK